MLKSTVSVEDKIPVVILEGRLDGTGGIRLRELASSFDPATTHAVLEMERVDYVSSAGIRVLLILEKDLRKAGGGLLLARPSPFVSQVLSSSGLLGELRTAADVADALKIAQLQAHARRGGRSHHRAGRGYTERPLAVGRSWLTVFGGPPRPEGGAGLVPVALSELNYGLGVGGFGSTVEQAQGALGPFVAMGRAAGILPDHEGELADFIIAGNGVSPLMYVQRGLGFSGTPAAVIDVTSGPAVSMDNLVTDLLAFRDPAAVSPPFLAFIVVAQASGIPDPGIEPGTGLIVLGVAASAGESGTPDGLLERALHELPAAAGQSRLRLMCHGLVVDRVSAQPAATQPDEDLAPCRHIDRLRHVLRLDPALPVAARRVWLFEPVAS